MSQIVVEVEGIGELEFPDGTDPAVIQSTVRRLVAEQGAKPGEPDIAADIRAMPEGMARTQLLHAVEGRAVPIATLGGQPSVLDRPIRAIGNFVERRAVPMVRSALKPVWAEVRRRAGIEGQMPASVANKQAQFIVDKQLRKPEQADALVKSLGGQIDDVVSRAEQQSPNLALDTKRRIPRYMTSLLKRVEKQPLPRQDRTAIQNVGRELVEDSPLSRYTTPAERARHPQSSRPRDLRSDITPSEGLEIVRSKSFFNKDAQGGTIAGGKAVERAVRDAVKKAVPEARPLLSEQGRAMDARTLLDRANWRDANRDQINMGGLMGVAHGRPLTGLLLQLLKEKQLEAGLAAGRLGPRIARSAQPVGDELQKAVMALLAQTTQGQE